jgi:hypothetical protein
VARVLALACCIAVAPRAAVAKERVVRQRTASGAASRAEAIVVGSSSMNQALGHLIARELEQRGYRVTRKGVSAAGLARPDYRDMNQIMDELPITSNTAAVFVYLGMNDAQAMWLWPGERRAFGRQFLPWSDARWQGLYLQRAQRFFERICQRGAHRTIVLLPVDVQRDRLQHRLKRIRELQTRAAQASSCAVAISTEGDLGRFEVGGVAKRKRDGLHMSPLGASAVWRRIESQALGLVGASGPLREPHGQPWCSMPCRLGQGLRYRHTARPSEWVDTIGIAASRFGSGAGCTAW